MQVAAFYVDAVMLACRDVAIQFEQYGWNFSLSKTRLPAIICKMVCNLEYKQWYIYTRRALIF